MELSDSEENTIYTIRIVMGSISLMGSSSIIIVYLLHKSLWSFFMRLVIYLIVSDAFRSIGFLLTTREHISCVLQTVILEYTVVSTVLWALLISIALYLGIVKKSSTIEKREIWFLLIGYGFPAILAGIQFLAGADIKTSGWCYISIDEHDSLGRVIRFFCFYGPILVSCLVSMVLYYKIIREISKSLQNIPQEVRNKRKIIARLMLYPIVIFICLIPIFVLWGEILKDVENFTICLLIVIIGGPSGLFNALIYGFNDSVREVLFKRCRKNRSSSYSSYEALESVESPDNLND